MQEGILLLVVTGAMFWLCLWFITDRSKPSKYWWPFDMPIHGENDHLAGVEDNPQDWRHRRQGSRAAPNPGRAGDTPPGRSQAAKDSERTWRRSGS
ncbi:MAG: hypothetical protein KGL12_16305 [Rhodospirillales bacterium]|nr:hypothetical protein [Rhodospirillales bacterium]